jgi:hypothetical protein
MRGEVPARENRVGFLKRSTGGNQPEQPDVAAVVEMRRAGADPAVPHQTRHFIFVPGVRSAQHVARSLRNPDRTIEIDNSARKGYWLVVVRQSMLVAPETIAAIRSEIEAAAGPVGGEYDRWQVDLDGG